MDNKKYVVLSCLGLLLIWINVLYARNGNMGAHDGYVPDGTVQTPFYIEDIDDFQEFYNNTIFWVNGTHVKLLTNIDLHGFIFQHAVISSDDNDETDGFQGYRYAGIFDGCNNQIQNLTIDTTGSHENYLGLFGNIDEVGEVRNLLIVNIQCESNSSSVGGLCGQNNGKIQNCHSSGTVSGKTSVGGLVGFNVGYLGLCKSTVSVEGAENDIGGLIGKNTGTVENSSATGDVSAGNDCAGGLIGYNNANSKHISNCYAANAITGKDEIGGLIGAYLSGIVTNCYAKSIPPFEDLDGGLIGKNRVSPNCSDCFNNSYFINTAPNNHQGVALSQEQMTLQASYPGWDFTDIWYLQEGIDCPKLIDVDNLRPVAKCKNVHLLADDSGFALITLADVDAGSYDPEYQNGITLIEPLISIEPSDLMFGIGEHAVTLTIRDASGLEDSCQTIVHVYNRTDFPGFNYQGRLEKAGKAAQGAFNMIFSFYTKKDGGTQKGLDIEKAVFVTDGAFSVELHPIDPDNLDKPFFDGQPCWLEMQVQRGDDPAYYPIIPRQQIKYSPYAITASNVSCPRNGDILKEYTPGNYQSIVPVAYGLVHADGTIVSGSGNFTCQYYDGSYPNNYYAIRINGHNDVDRDYMTLVTPYAEFGRTYWVDQDEDRIQVHFQYLDGSFETRCNFYFIVYRP